MNAHHTSAPEVTIKSKQQGGNDFYLIVSAEVRLDGKVYTVRINDLVPASKSFEEIQERDHRLEHHRVHLEEEVDDRTAELKKSRDKTTTRSNASKIEFNTVWIFHFESNHLKLNP